MKRRVFVGTGICALALMSVMLAGCGDEYERGAGVYTVTAPAVVTQPPAAPPAAERAPQPAPSAPAESAEVGRLSKRLSRIVRAAKRDARRFLPGYLRYSYGERVRVRNVFPGALPRDPPRLVPGLETEARPRLERDGLVYSGSHRGRVILVARITDGSALTLTMRRRGGGWAVERVR